ncbi:hypothetical protein BC828DRAFT_416385, partial [Blastocladiella britannica]
MHRPSNSRGPPPALSMPNHLPSGSTGPPPRPALVGPPGLHRLMPAHLATTRAPLLFWFKLAQDARGAGCVWFAVGHILYRREHGEALRKFYHAPTQARIKRCNEVQKEQFQEEFVRSLGPECRTPCERAGVIVVTGDSGRFASLRGFAPAAVGWFELLCIRCGYTVVQALLWMLQ